MDIACSETQYYNKEQVGAIVAAAISAVLQSASTQNLDNDIVYDNNSFSIQQHEGETNMPSMHCETYTYLSNTNDIRTIKLYGISKSDTDKKFQTFLMTKDTSQTPTLREFTEETYYPGFIANLANNTIANYNVYLNNYIYPFLGNMKMNMITVSTIQQFYDYLASGNSHGLRNNINKRSIERISGLCSRIFKVALEMNVVSSTPFKHTLLRNHGVSAGHHKVIPDNIAQTVRSNIKTLPNACQRLYTGLLCYTGLRREEILGMRWEYLHLKEKYGEVHNVVVYPGNNKPVVKDTPKTVSSERIFILPDSLIEILEPEQHKRGYVIHGDTTEDLLPYSTMQRMYRNAFEHLGISEYNNHDWRTTYATELKESGMSSAQVADLLGHADTRMVETVYARARKDGILKHKNTIDCILNPDSTTIKSSEQ